MADDLDYVPLPDAVKELVHKSGPISIKDASGKTDRTALSGRRRGRLGVRTTTWPLHFPPPRSTNPRRWSAPSRRAGRPPRAAPSPWADALFSPLAHGAAWLTLALLAGIIVSLIDRRGAGDQAVRPRLPLVDASGIRSRTTTAAW